MNGKFNGILAIVIITILLYLAEIPFLSLLAQVFIHLFLLGFIARAWLDRGQENIFAESVFLSIVVTISLGFILGNFFTVADFSSRLIIILLAVLGSWLKMSQLAKNISYLKNEDSKYFLALSLLVAMPMFAIFIFNPTYALISDGWWHCSIFNSIQLDNLPPKNPWYSSEPLAYPYAYYIYLSYAAKGLTCFGASNFFGFLTSWAITLAVYLLAKEIYKEKKYAFVAGAAILFISHIGGAVFIYDILTKLPALGLNGFLQFLKDVHGPHVYYGQLNFMDSNIVIPFQIAIMNTPPQLLFLVVLLYFLLKQKTLPVAATLAALIGSHPVIGILGTAVTISYYAFHGIKKIPQLALIAVIVMLLLANYLATLATKTPVQQGGIIQLNPISLNWFIGFFVGYLPLIILTIQFFRQGFKQGKTALHNLLLIFLVIAVASLFFVRLSWLYVPASIVIVFAIASAQFFANVKKPWLSLAMAAILTIPTFLVVGSYSYYKIPLDSSQLEAAAWLDKNTPRTSVILPALDFEFDKELSKDEKFDQPLSAYLSRTLKIHLYPAVFGKRYLAFGDIFHLSIYGEDFRAGLRLHQQIFVLRNNETICQAKVQGINYLYVSDEKFYFPENTPCIKEVYKNERVRIYQTL